MDHRIEAERQLDVIVDELIRHGAAEAVAPALNVEPEKVIAIGAGAVDPELADHAIGRSVLHRGLHDSGTSGLPLIFCERRETNLGPVRLMLQRSEHFASVRACPANLARASRFLMHSGYAAKQHLKR